MGKSNASTSSRYVYAGFNQLLAEHTNGAWTSYIWNGSEPVALVRNNAIYYVHDDHLGRPESVSGSDGAGNPVVVWKASNTAFDRTVTMDAIGGLNLGFPGQYYDAESGIWHNGYREYLPDLGGRYLQSDPIGLAGGTNTYAYVSGGPTFLVDEYGLFDVYARSVKGEIRYKVDFYNSFLGYARDTKFVLLGASSAMSPWGKAAKWLDRAATFLEGDAAGVSTTYSWEGRRICDKTDKEAKEIFKNMFGENSAGKTLSAEQLSNFVRAVNSSQGTRYDAGVMMRDARIKIGL